MAATVDVLHIGYADDRVAGTVVLVRDEGLVAVVDPGMVASRSLILEPLADLGIAPHEVTDVILSHHHPDHTVNIALFPEAAVHDFQATYVRDEWTDAEYDHHGRRHLSPAVALALTPGHTPQDISTVITTADGLVVCTHLWWSALGPQDDPFAPDAAVLGSSRQAILDLRPTLIVPGHGAPYAP